MACLFFFLKSHIRKGGASKKLRVFPRCFGKIVYLCTKLNNNDTMNPRKLLVCLVALSALLMAEASRWSCSTDL